MSEYEAQANEFLNRFHLTLKAAWKSSKTPPWSDGAIHGGDQYRVTIKRKAHGSMSFDFWNSAHAKEQGKHPTAYDVLACISGDIHCPDTFADFCDEYGYNKDSRKDEALFRRASAFMRKLRAFFSDEEMEALGEIR